MKISVKAFAQLSMPTDVVIHSLEQALYQVTVIVDGVSSLLVDVAGRPLRFRSLQGAREILQTLPVASITLRHESAYDEMIGQPSREQGNTLEVKLSSLDYPAPTIH